ncbi:MAG: OpgC domain-containing protein [Methylotetracoccus sp.]|nr:OpgC domain-containing protein [Methylotetracoccus sp.]
MSRIENPTQRNIKLDFFRGVALLIIYINHIPGNELLLYTPSRFGLSDAAEIFVFLSGYAAAIAYGRSFRTAGFALGSFRVFHRCVQIYAAHLGLFALMAMICVLGSQWLETQDYVTHLNIRYFFDHTEAALLGLVSLQYVPNYFDILPMYLVVMLWIPGIVAMSGVHRIMAMAFPPALYLAMWMLGLEFSADPNSARPWFFNPFGWQLLFFIGFAFGSNWLRVPATHPWLVAASVAFLVIAVPFSPEPAMRPTEWLQGAHAMLQPLLEKTRFGPLRLIHFLALAYLVIVSLRYGEQWLQRTWAQSIVQMGRQSLPIFVVSMALSYVGGMAYDVVGHHAGSILWINLGGCLLLILAGYGLAWIKSSPWKQAGSGLPAEDGRGGALGSLPPLRWEWVKGGAMFALLGAVTAFPLWVSRKAADMATSPVTLSESAWVLDDLSAEPPVADPEEFSDPL